MIDRWGILDRAGNIANLRPVNTAPSEHHRGITLDVLTLPSRP